MKRESALETIKLNTHTDKNGYGQGDMYSDHVEIMVEEIYDDQEEYIKKVDEYAEKLKIKESQLDSLLEEYKNKHIELKNRTCESCKYCKKESEFKNSYECNKDVSMFQSDYGCFVNKDFSCNKWEK